MVGIYKISNVLNNKTYYGQTTNYEKRRKEHLTALRGGYHPNSYLQRSWEKYGEKFFVFSFVESCSADKLDELEIKYISDKNTLVPRGYNMTAGGDGVRGFKFSPEQVKGFSERSKKMWEADGFRERLRSTHIGHRHSDETRAKMSASHKGQPPARTRAVRCIETGEVFPALRKVVAAGKTACPSYIRRACVRGTKAYGCHWEYLDDP